MITTFSSQVQVPFSTYFDVGALSSFHRVLPMEEFMMPGGLAETLWPSGGERTALCYTHRRGSEELSCNAKEGNPFGPFWDTFNVS